MANFFEKHGVIAKKFENETINAGRYSFQKRQEKKIPKDVIKKLKVNKRDICLDIGCNLGAILLPISKIVNEITGIDQPHCIQRLKSKLTNSKNIKLIENDFFEHDFNNKKYDKIIIYSVIHAMKNKKEVYKFINKALSLLKPTGALLIGDIPNSSLKKRFLNSKYGKKFTKEWIKKNKMTKKDKDAQRILSEDIRNDLKINDEFILEIVTYLRKRGNNVYWLKQPSDLPFGHTREDLLIERL
tara:strand:- start:2762 stop:3490 length:729 start_codon:yes stop_codon:yes gene_type:complete